jgi:hypothetical protein
MHENPVWTNYEHQVRHHDVKTELSDLANPLLFRITHKHPHIGVEDGCVLRCGDRVVLDLDDTSAEYRVPTNALDDHQIEFPCTNRTEDNNMYTQHNTHEQPRVNHVVTIAEIDELPSDKHAQLDRSEILDDGEPIHKNLDGIILVNENIDHGNKNVNHHLIDIDLCEDANDEDGGETANNASGVYNRLTTAELQFISADEDRSSAKMCDYDLQCQARPRR